MGDIKEIIGKGITDSYLHSDIETIRKNLADHGVDLDKNRKLQNQKIKQLKFKLQGTLNKKMNESLLQRATDSFIDAINKGLDKPVAYLNSLIKENRIAVQYNNLDKLSSKEIKEIIKDQNLIEIIEQLEKQQRENKS